MQSARRVLLVLIAGLTVVLAFDLAAGSSIQHAEAAPNRIRATAATLETGCSPTSPDVSLLILPNDGSLTVYLCVIVTDSVTGLGVAGQQVSLIIISESPVVTASSTASTLPPPLYLTDARGVVAVQYTGTGPVGSSSFVVTISTPNDAQAGLPINLVTHAQFQGTGIPATPPPPIPPTLTPTPQPSPSPSPTPAAPPPAPSPTPVATSTATGTPAAPPPAPSPTPVATSTATGTPAPPPQFTGGRVASDGISIVAFTGTMSELNAAGLTAGAVSISATMNGRLLTYIVGAPGFVNAEFISAFPNGLNNVLVVLRTQSRQSIRDAAFIQASGLADGDRRHRIWFQRLLPR